MSTAAFKKRQRGNYFLLNLDLPIKEPPLYSSIQNVSQMDSWCSNIKRNNPSISTTKNNVFVWERESVCTEKILAVNNKMVRFVIDWPTFWLPWMLLPTLERWLIILWRTFFAASERWMKARLCVAIQVFALLQSKSTEEIKLVHCKYWQPVWLVRCP